MHLAWALLEKLGRHRAALDHRHTSRTTDGTACIRQAHNIVGA